MDITYHKRSLPQLALFDPVYFWQRKTNTFESKCMYITESARLLLIRIHGYLVPYNKKCKEERVKNGDENNLKWIPPKL